MNALDQLELEELQTFEQNEGFSIQSLNEADWALRKIAALNKQKEEKAGLAKERIEFYKNWLTKETESIEQSISYFEMLLGKYLLEQRKTDKKFKISTPFGKVSTRKQPPKWELNDEKVLAALKENEMDGLIRIKEEVNKVELKKAVSIQAGRAITEDGVILEGVTVIEQPEKIVVKVDE